MLFRSFVVEARLRGEPRAEAFLRAALGVDELRVEAAYAVGPDDCGALLPHLADLLGARPALAGSLGTWFALRVPDLCAAACRQVAPLSDEVRGPFGDALLRQLEDLWQRQLARRDLGLQLQIDPDLPPVLSDPARLETMLGGLIDRFSRSLSAGSVVQLTLQAAGPKLKLHLSTTGLDRPEGLESRADPEHSPEAAHGREQVGPVLSWNPATGSLQLSRQATQRLFERLGGRLTERSGSGLTVFFPVC